MSSAHRRGAGATVSLCRGCCCGHLRKHPHTDHLAQAAGLRELAATSGGAVSFRTTDCLGPCSLGNVVVVSPSARGRAAGARPVWFGLVTDAERTESITAWVTAGGPGVAPLPPDLDLLLIEAPRPPERPSRRGRARAR